MTFGLSNDNLGIKILKVTLLVGILLLETAGVFLMVFVGYSVGLMAALICATVLFGPQLGMGLFLWAMDDSPGPINGA